MATVAPINLATSCMAGGSLSGPIWDRLQTQTHRRWVFRSMVFFRGFLKFFAPGFMIFTHTSWGSWAPDNQNRVPSRSWDHDLGHQVGDLGMPVTMWPGREHWEWPDFWTASHTCWSSWFSNIFRDWLSLLQGWSAIESPASCIN